jgi:hypothetical protein
MDNIKMGLVGIGWDGYYGLDWSDSGQIKVLSTWEGGNELSGSLKCWETTELLHNSWLL